MTKSSFFNFSAILCPIIVKYDGHLPFSNICKFCKRDFSLQPPGNPREQHPGDARQRTSLLKFFFFFVNQSKTIIQEVYMRENSFLPSEEPQEQHKGEGAQEIL